MRLFHAILLLPLLSCPAVAAQPPRDGPPPAGEHHGRRTMEQHFTDANLSRDGRLTLEQAKEGYKSVAKSFAKIDLNHRGYVTLDDLRAWKAAKKAAKQQQSGGRSGGGSQRGADFGRMNSIPEAIRTVQFDLPKAPLDGALFS